MSYGCSSQNTSNFFLFLPLTQLYLIKYEGKVTSNIIDISRVYSYDATPCTYSLAILQDCNIYSLYGETG